MLGNFSICVLIVKIKFPLILTNNITLRPYFEIQYCDTINLMLSMEPHSMKYHNNIAGRKNKCQCYTRTVEQNATLFPCLNLFKNTLHKDVVFDELKIIL